MSGQLRSSAEIALCRMATLGLWRNKPAAPAAVVRHLTAMQAQEHAFARWSVGQRARATSVDIDAAFDEGGFLRTHVLRPTWHYVAAEDLRWLTGLSGEIVDRRNSRRYRELELDAGTRAKATEAIASAVATGSLTRRELADELERLGISTEGQRLPYLLMHAELHGAICSGPMRGKEHTYAAFDQRVPPGSGPTGDEALAELACRYFTTRGPATVADFAWWAGLPRAAARRAVALVDGQLKSRVVDGRTYLFAEAHVGPKGPNVELVQCYDEAIISYTESRDVLATPRASFAVPRHIDGFTHVVLLDGRLLGHWRLAKQRADATVETRLAHRLPKNVRAALEAAICVCEAFFSPHNRRSGAPSPRT